MNFENDVKIEQDALDVECLQQPHLMLRYARVVADAERTLSEAKRNLDLQRAQLDTNIRTTPEDYGIAKITESAINAVIIQSPEYKEAEETVFQAQYELKIARGAVDAIQQKKDMLEALIRLHGQQYFAGPKVPRDLDFEWRQKQSQESADIHVIKGMKRR